MDFRHVYQRHLQRLYFVLFVVSLQRFQFRFINDNLGAQTRGFEKKWLNLFGQKKEWGRREIVLPYAYPIMIQFLQKAAVMAFIPFFEDAV